MNQNPEENLDLMKQACLKPKKKKGRALIALLIVSMIAVSVFFVAYYFGFIPIGLAVREPVGNVETIDVDMYIDEFPELADMPNLDKIEYAAYGTDASIDEIDKDYDKRLTDDGYHLDYTGTFEVDGTTFEVKGYLKGLTAVAILTTDEDNEIFDYESLVMYATGNALDFQEILNWYENF